MDFPLVNFDPVTGVAFVGIPTVPRRVVGLNKLVQIVVIAILKNGGQAVIDPEQGSGLRAMIGYFNYTTPTEIQVEVLKRVKLIEKQIISNQNGFDLAASEKLVSLKVMQVATDPATGATAVKLKVNNQAGQSTTLVV